MAIVFGILPKTTEIHPRNSIRKLGAQNRVEWTRATIRKAVVTPPCHLCLDAPSSGGGSMKPQRIAFDKAMAVAGPAGTLQMRNGELAVACARIAGFGAHERELLDLIRRTEASV